jgi:hypothetical protein
MDNYMNLSRFWEESYKLDGKDYGQFPAWNGSSFKGVTMYGFFLPSER